MRKIPSSCDCTGIRTHVPTPEGYSRLPTEPTGRPAFTTRIPPLQEGLAFRDVPQTTYSRLVRLAAESRASNEKRANSAKSKLEQMEVCEALLYKLPSGLRETLLPFQRDGVLYGLRRRGRCLIADEMGTGKVG